MLFVILGMAATGAFAETRFEKLHMFCACQIIVEEGQDRNMVTSVGG